MKKVINRKQYNTETAVEICNDGILGQNQVTRNDRIYLTKKGTYFCHHQTMWQGEHDDITLLTEEEAEEMYTNSCNKEVEFQKAFPNIEVEEG